MKPAQIFHQYIWIINILRAYRQLTFEELNQKWQEDDVADGNPLQRSSFNRHRDAILNMFGVIIDCDAKGSYQYFIANRDVFDDEDLVITDSTNSDDIEDWDSLEHISLIISMEKELA